MSTVPAGFHSFHASVGKHRQSRQQSRLGQRIQRRERRILFELTCLAKRCHVLNPDLVLSHHLSHIHEVSIYTEVQNTQSEEVEVNDVLLQVESVEFGLEYVLKYYGRSDRVLLYPYAILRLYSVKI